MASTETAPQTSEPVVAKPGLSLFPLVLTVLGVVLLALGAAGGVAYWLYSSGHLGWSAKTNAAAPKPAAELVKPVRVEVVLEPALVNLTGGDGHGYLRVAVTLVTEPKPLPKGAKEAEAKPEKGKAHNEYESAERDALLDVLGRQTDEALLEPDGKEKLKQQIRATLKVRVPEVTVSEVLFTDFLVQR